MPPNIHEPIIGLPGYKLISYEGIKSVYFNVELTVKPQCPYCEGRDPVGDISINAYRV